MREYLIIVVSVILVNNLVLAQFLGICPFLGVSKKLENAVGMGLAVTFVMALASAVTWPVNEYLLTPNYEYLRTLAFIVVIAALVQLVEIILKRYIPALHRALGVYLPLITTNCAVLGATLLNIESAYSFDKAVLNGVAGGIGFLLAMVLFAGVRQRMESAKVPKCFEGIPITLIAASILAVAFMGFGGVVDGLFA